MLIPVILTQSLLETFFASNASTDRKYRGFQIFRQALTRVSEDDVPMLFTPNLLRCWINNLSVNERYLHRMTLQLVRTRFHQLHLSSSKYVGKRHSKAS
jgi:hypothetical protein